MTSTLKMFQNHILKKTKTELMYFKTQYTDKAYKNAY